MRSTNAAPVTIIAPTKKKGRKSTGIGRRVRITNTHLKAEGIDLSKGLRWIMSVGLITRSKLLPPDFVKRKGS